MFITISCHYHPYSDYQLFASCRSVYKRSNFHLLYLRSVKTKHSSFSYSGFFVSHFHWFLYYFCRLCSSWTCHFAKYVFRFALYLVRLWVDKLWFTSLLSGLATSRFLGLESRAFVFLSFFYNPEISRTSTRKFGLQCPEHRKLSTIGHFSWWWPWIQNDDVREFEKYRLKFSKWNPFHPCHPPA